MGDAWLIIAVFVFAFILWVSTGGPSRPISFAGPYITPITDVGDVQTGYGSGVNINTGSAESSPHLWSVKSVFGRFENSVSGGDTGPVSPAAGKVAIVSGAGGPSGKTVDNEYVTLRAASETDITGWQLVSAKSGALAILPQGTIAPRNGPRTDIVLAAGEEAIVTTGTGTSFRENACTGYLANGSYVPPLSTRSCPSPSEELGAYTGSASAYDECKAVVSGLNRCETPRDIPRDTPRDCENFINAHFNYDGCVATHFNESDFRGDTWRVYLGKQRELWRSDNETIKLLDTQGRTVDIYSY